MYKLTTSFWICVFSLSLLSANNIARIPDVSEEVLEKYRIQMVNTIIKYHRIKGLVKAEAKEKLIQAEIKLIESQIKIWNNILLVTKNSRLLKANVAKAKKKLVQTKKKLAQAQINSQQERKKFLLQIHEKIFAIFLPPNLPLTDKQKRLMAEVKTRLWELIKKNLKVQKGLLLLGYFPGLSHKNPVVSARGYYKLIQSPMPLVRKLAKEFRYLYIYSIYSSELGKDIASYHQQARPIVHPQIEKIIADFQKTAANFDTSSLSYKDGEVAHKAEEFDYLIVGAGTAGSVIAHELSQKNKKVIVVERGSFVVPGALDPVRIDVFKEKRNLRTSHDGAIVIRNANVVGGGSLVNIDLAFAPTLATIKAKIKNWHKTGRIKENQFTPEQVTKAYNWVKKAVGTRKLNTSELNENNKILYQGSHKMGWTPSLYDLNRYPSGKSPFPVSEKIPVTKKLLVKALSNKNLYVLSDCEVQTVLYNLIEKKAVGVKVTKLANWYSKGVIKDLHNVNIPTGTTFTIRAKNIILAAGSMGSATILLRSKLDQINPNIGKGIVIHPSIPLIGIFEHKINIMEGLTASVYNDHFALSEGFIFEAMSAGPEYGAVMLQGSGEEIYHSIKKYAHMGGFGVMLVDTSRKKNRIKIDAKGRTEIHYRVTTADRKRFRKGVKKGIKILFAAGAKKITIPSVEIIGEQSSAFFTNVETALKAVDKLQFIPNQTILTSAHMQASNKMGTSPKNSVVDTNFRFWGFSNLYIADGSIFPTSVGANPMQMIYTTAKIFADSLNE